MGLIDRGGEIVSVPIEEVSGEKQFADGTQHFRLLGGPHHDMLVRYGPPYDRIVFGTVAPCVVYELMPPMTKSGKWVFVHTTADTRPYTEDERHPTGVMGPMQDSREIAFQMASHAAYKALVTEPRVAALAAKRKGAYEDALNDEEID